MNVDSNFQLPEETFDDVEGHKKSPLIADDEDVEGHKKSPLVPDIDDVEGHKMPHGRGISSGRDAGDDEVEGHSASGRF